MKKIELILLKRILKVNATRKNIPVAFTLKVIGVAFSLKVKEK
jgi:hypothetical protein